MIDYKELFGLEPFEIFTPEQLARMAKMIPAGHSRRAEGYLTKIIRELRAENFSDPIIQRIVLRGEK